MEPIRLSEREFGLLLKEDRRLTFHTRLVHRLCILGFSTYRDYYNYIVSDGSRREMLNLISHLANNETYFMREKIQIDVFVNILKDIKHRKIKDDRKEVRILSAGCSTGEEVYSINIALIESGLFSWGWDVRVFGIDVSGTAIRKARSATYTRNSFRMIGSYEDFVKRYFNIDGDKYTLRGPYRRNTEFIQGNILDPELFKGLKGIDIIFCRNVMIYMTDDGIQGTAKNFYDCLNDDGYLFLGTSESLLQKTDLFIPELREGVIVYRKNTLQND